MINKQELRLLIQNIGHENTCFLELLLFLDITWLHKDKIVNNKNRIKSDYVGFETVIHSANNHQP